MDNATRRQLLDRAKSSGYPGDILDVFSAYDQGKDLIGEYVQEQQMGTTSPPMQIAQTPEEQEQGLRPAHAAGNFNQSMAFPNVQPGQSFNTMGMKDNINIEKFNDQGNLVESYKNVPPGIVNLPTGPYEGTVIESPARMKTGGAEKDPPTKKKIYTEKDTDEVKTTFKDWGTGVPKPTPPIRNPLSEADLRKGYTWSPELGVIAPQVEIIAERPYDLINVPGGYGSMVTAKRYKDGTLSYSPETVAAMNASNEIARSNNEDKITKGFAIAASLPTVGRLLGTEILGTGINAGNILNPLFIGHGIYNTVNPNSDFRQAITKYNQGKVGWENVAFEGGLNALNFLGARALPGDIKALGNIKAPRFKNVSTDFMSLDAPKGNMYGENQVLVQQARLLNPATKAKFFKHQAPMVEVTPDKLQKTPKDYNNRITPENYEDFVKKIHGSTDYDFALTVYKQPTNLGIGNYGIPGMVFKDAPLSNLGKDVINAHEKNHGIFVGTLSREMEQALLKPFGTKKPIPNYGEKAQADEVLARMAQFKNALGMGDDQIFTLGHLNWIRKHYANSFIDNSITAMLSKIKPGSEGEKEFLRNMNEYAFGIGALTAVGTAAVNKPRDFKTGGVNKYQTAGVEKINITSPVDVTNVQVSTPANLPWIGDKGQVLSKDQQDDKQFGLGPRIEKSTEKDDIFFKKTSGFERNTKKQDDLISIKDPRKIRLTTGKELDPNRDLMSKSYPTSTLRDIISTAKARGLSKDDALTLAAMDLQETQWGIIDDQVGHVITEDVSKPPVERFIDAYLKSKETADRLKLKDEYTRLQVYNGLGTITPDTEKTYHGFRMKKIYGVPVPESGINMRENPLYGKQIVDLRDNVLKKNPEFLKLVDSYYLKKMGGVRKYQTAGLEEEDKRTLESGTIVDKGTNTLNVVKGGKITQTFPVLTGQAGRNPKTDVNRNVGSLDDLESNPAARSTPTGVYKMAPNPNVYGWPGYDLNPIPAFGQPAPEANDTAIHITYGANPKPGANLEGHTDPAEFKRRNAAYNMDSSKRYLSYGCTNAQGEAINCLEQTFPQGDTAIYIDSRFDRDSRFFDKFRNEEPPVPVREEEPIVAQRPEEQPEERPIRYTFDPEFGTVVSSPIEVTPTTGKKKIKSKAKKRETGGPDTNQEVAMYEWRSGLPEDSRKRYFIGGLKNRVLYNKAKYKR